MSNNHQSADRSESKKMSRSSFLGSLGALGALGTMPFLASSCSEKKVEHTVYEGAHREAIIDNILTRRSIRKYTDQQVPEDVLDTIMKCAIFAPSAINAQPWEVRVIQNPEILQEISKRHLNYLISNNKKVPDAKEYSAVYHAPTLVVIARDITGPGTLPTFLDSGIILQTILLAAHGLNIGTCTLGGLVPFLNHESNTDLLRLFKIPEDCELAINIAMGYPDESPEAPIRYSDKVKIIR